MMEKVVEVEHLMAPILDGMQMRHLHAVLVSCFCEDGHVEGLGGDDAEHCIAAFLAAKRLEGCSERSLGYYASTLNGFADAVGKRMGAVTTDDIRDYLSEYQSAHGASNVTVDNVRRILSSFFSWLEAEDFIYKSPVKWLIRGCGRFLGHCNQAKARASRPRCLLSSELSPLP